MGIEMIAYPAIDMWGKIFGRPVAINIFQDNQATMRVLLTGKINHEAPPTGTMLFTKLDAQCNSSWKHLFMRL